MILCKTKSWKLILHIVISQEVSAFLPLVGLRAGDEMWCGLVVHQWDQACWRPPYSQRFPREDGNIPVTQGSLPWQLSTFPLPTGCCCDADRGQQSPGEELRGSVLSSTQSQHVFVTLLSSSCLLSPATCWATHRRAAILLPVLPQEQPCSLGQMRKCMPSAAAAYGRLRMAQYKPQVQFLWLGSLNHPCRLAGIVFDGYPGNIFSRITIWTRNEN